MEKLSTSTSGDIVVRLSKMEVVALANALNEARESVEEWEFATRLGVTPSDAESLRRQLGDLLSLQDEGERSS